MKIGHGGLICGPLHPIYFIDQQSNFGNTEFFQSPDDLFHKLLTFHKLLSIWNILQFHNLE